jgi:hypothetical protein
LEGSVTEEEDACRDGVFSAGEEAMFGSVSELDCCECKVGAIKVAKDPKGEEEDDGEGGGG